VDEWLDAPSSSVYHSKCVIAYRADDIFSTHGVVVESRAWKTLFTNFTPSKKVRESEKKSACPSSSGSNPYGVLQSEEKLMFKPYALRFFVETKNI
jgi:hypothetical protein